MQTDPAALADFYEQTYSRGADQSRLGERWRALSAVGKADHVIELCRRAGLSPSSVADVGCGDGALLSELHRRGFGGRLVGFEISAAAARLARGRPGIEYAGTFDGRRLPLGNGEADLGVLSHVLEHVPDPPALLAETARACRAVVLEVPLEDNLSARRPSKQAGADEVGHIQRLDLGAVRALAAAAGLRVAAELDDPLPRQVHRFFATTATERARADAKWAVRASLTATAPPLARRLFTVHHACLCLPAVSRAAA